MSEIRTFHPRRGRMTPAQLSAIERLLPVHGLPPGPLSLPGPVVVEVGFGLGHATVEMARAEPGTTIVAVDVHTPGVARLLLALDREGLDNVRVEHGDAVALLRDRVAEGRLDGIRAFFPDPWPKARHHKRRLVRPDLVALMASRLRPGGRLHLATDWEPYAEAMLEVLDAEPTLVNVYERWAPRLERPLTKFERQGLDQGRVVRDVIVERV
jgi:tRNA (guanine-N7-)-methyltransferase